MTSFPASPCVGICTLDDAELCLGCGRQLNEIVEWTRLSAEQQQQVVKLSAQRLQALDEIPAAN